MSTEEIDNADAQAYADIKARIDQLQELSGEELSGEMTLLKGALKANPNACALMLPEDIGELVSALQRITGKYLESKAKPASKKAASPKAAKFDFGKLSAEEQQAILDEL